MSNVFTGDRENKISRVTQAFLRKMAIVPAIASFREEATLVDGQSVNRPYKNTRFTMGNYTPNTDVTSKDLTITQQLLTVNNSKYGAFKWDPVEQVQISHNIEEEYSPELAYQLKDIMERDFFAEVANASYTVDAGTFGGTSGSPVDLASVDIFKVASDTWATLDSNSVEHDKRWYWVIDPFQFSAIQQKGVTRFSLGDAIFKNGYTGDEFGGFDIYVCNNLPASYPITIATNPSNNETLLVNGVTWTWKTALTPAAGEILIGANAAASAANLVLALTAGSGSGTNYVDVGNNARGDSQRDKYTNASLSASAVSAVVTITAAGRITVSGTVVTSTHVTLGSQTIKTMAAKQGAVDAVVQMRPRIQINKAVGNLGYQVIGHVLYGFKTFWEGSDRMCRVDIKA